MTRVQAELDETKIILVRLQGHGQLLLPALGALGVCCGAGWSHPRPFSSSLLWELPFLFPFFTSPPFFSLGFPQLAGHKHQGSEPCCEGQFFCLLTPWELCCSCPWPSSHLSWGCRAVGGCRKVG